MKIHEMIANMGKKKFATQISQEVFRDLQAYVSESNRKISDVVDEAIEAHLKTVRVRPAFRSAAEQIINQHSKSVRRLAK